MKKSTLLIVMMTMGTLLMAQEVTIEGKAKITVMDPATASAQQVAIEPDGTLSQMSMSTPPTYAIGDFVQGGVVFWLSASGTHGKVVSIYEIGATLWSLVPFTEIGATAQSDINGAGNTVAVILQAGHTISAAQHCALLAYGGYDDWYLPSVDELTDVYTNRVAINTTATANGGEDFGTLYWSSTESSSTGAKFYNFDLGTNGNTNKNSSIEVRAVRAF